MNQIGFDVDNLFLESIEKLLEDSPPFRSSSTYPTQRTSLTEIFGRPQELFAERKEEEDQIEKLIKNLIPVKDLYDFDEDTVTVSMSYHRQLRESLDTAVSLLKGLHREVKILKKKKDVNSPQKHQEKDPEN